MNKAYEYNMKTKYLKEFQEIYKKAKDTSDKRHLKYKKPYQFYLNIPHRARELYNKWKKHQGFKGTMIRKVERTEDGEIIDVPDGIVFPILAFMSAFVILREDSWKYPHQAFLMTEKIIKAAKSTYMDIAHSNLWNREKSKACYSALYQISSIYKKSGEVSKEQGQRV